jgi:hypothetical protein
MAERSLDAEGMPDLDGPLPGKQITGDPQEGLAPPNDAPGASVDYGTTADEESRPEPIELRIAREEPDVDVIGTVGTEDELAPDLTGEPMLDDQEKDLVADPAPPGDPGEGLSAEEAAMHVVEAP